VVHWEVLIGAAYRDDTVSDTLILTINASLVLRDVGDTGSLLKNEIHK